ncbi:MAG: 4Fe-4S binding protein [Dehalococcoidia bacterium]|nr:4Fe-4S binding protein [Dehalococcoidia bacterium]
MSDSTNELYDSYPMENKGDFFSAYVYMKYIDHFIYHAMQASGLPAREPEEILDRSLDDLVRATVQRVADGAADLATSFYHGKVLKLEDAIQLVTQKVDLSLITPETVIPFKLAKDIILKNPQWIAAGRCPCRAASEKPCLPMEVCFFVGDPGASFIADHNPHYRKVTQEEAVSILEAEHKRGHVHTAYFKKDMGNRFSAICNCCGCCCMGIRMWNLLEGAVPIMAPSGYVSHVGDRCNGCGECVGYCQFKAVSLDDNGQEAVINTTKCMGCGVCEDICPVGAVTLERDLSKGEPLDMRQLMSKLD